MAVNNVAAVQQLYVAYFNRPADVAGLAYWSGLLDSGAVSVAQIGAQFAASQEYQADYPGLSNDQIIDRVYRDLFSRPADLGGLSYWSSKVSAGALTLNDVVSAISGSAMSAGSGGDYVTLRDKVGAASAFTAALQGDAHAQAAYAGDASSTGVLFLIDVTGDKSYAESTSATALADVIANLNRYGTPPQPVVLSTGVDTVTGRYFMGTIDTIDASKSTFNAGDSLTGTAGSPPGSTGNLLALTSNGAFAVPDHVTIANIQTVDVYAAGGVVIDATGWTGLTRLNVGATGGQFLTGTPGGMSIGSTGADTIRVAATTSVAVADTLATAASAAAATTIDGGAAVTLDANATTTAAQAAVGAIVIGAAAAPAGSVSVIASKTLDGGAAIDEGGVSVTGGAAVNVYTFNQVVTAVAAPGAIHVLAAQGAVIVSTHDDFSVGGQAGQAVHVDGGTSVEVDETLTSTASAGGAVGTALSASAGAVTVLGDAGTVSVTVAQSAPTAALAYSAAAAGVLGVVNGAVTIVDAHAATPTSASNTITTVALSNYGDASFTGNALASLSLSGVGGALAINNDAVGAALSNTTLTLHLHQASGANAVTDTNAAIAALNVVTSGGPSALAGLAADHLASLSFSGDGAVSIATLNDVQGGAMSIANTGTGGAAILDWSSNVTALGVSGDVALGSAAAGVAVRLLSNFGVSIAAAGDNADLNLALAAAHAGMTHTVSAGNGADHIVDATSAGRVVISVGGGADVIDLRAGSAATYAATVALGAHAAADTIWVGTVQAGAQAANTVISGAGAGDVLIFADAAAVTVAPLAAAQQAAIAASPSLAQAIAAAEALAPAAHSATVFQFNGNTYVIEASAAGNGSATQAGDAVIELVGLHTLAASAGAGTLHLLS